jgi:DHA1 family inner membrane transport protein
MSPVRRALLALALGGFGIGTGEFVMLGLLPEVARSLHISIPQAGYLVSAYALGVVVGAPLVTAFTVSVPRKGLLISIALLMAVTNSASAAAPGFASLLVCRFLTGLPHGAYFGVASVVASKLVREERRGTAMSVVFAGLTVANVVGVPMTTLIGQHSSWRLVFALVAGIEVVAAVAVFAAVPVDAADLASEPTQLRDEMGAFRQPQVWLALGIAMIGGGALFCTFSYIAPLMMHVAGYSESDITPLLILFGLGMTLGNLVGARLADRALMRTIYTAMSCEVVLAVLFFFGAHDQVTAAILVFMFPATSLALLPALQSRIVTLAGGAPNLAAASIHAAFNIANSIGAYAGGLVIAAGLGYAAVNLAAAGFAAVGLALAVASGRLDRRGAPALSA